MLKNMDSIRTTNIFFPKRKKIRATVKNTPGDFSLKRSRYKTFPWTIIHPKYKKDPSSPLTALKIVRPLIMNPIVKMAISRRYAFLSTRD